MNYSENIKNILINNKSILAYILSKIFNSFKNFCIDFKSKDDYLIYFEKILNISFGLYCTTNTLALYKANHDKYIYEIYKLLESNTELKEVFKQVDIQYEIFVFDVTPFFVALLDSLDEKNKTLIDNIKKGINTFEFKTEKLAFINLLFVKTLHLLFIYISELQNIDIELSTIIDNALNHYRVTLSVAESTYPIFNTLYQKKEFSFDDYQILIALFTIKNHFKIPEKEYFSNLLNIDVNYNEEEIINALTSNSNTDEENSDNFIKEALFSCMNINYKLKDVIEFIDSFDYKKTNIVNLLEKHKLEKVKNNMLNNIFENNFLIEKIDLMSGAEFEEFLCKMFNKLGYETSTTKASRDQGIDIIATKKDFTIGIQAKCYSKPVGNHAIMEAFAGAKYYGCIKSMVVTNNYFTEAAKELAKINDVQLWDRTVLVKKINEINGP